jgi:hypothetical protein
MRNRKIIIVFLIVLFLSFFRIVPNNFAEEKIIALKDITLVEHVFIGSYDTSFDKIEYAASLYGEDQFLLLSLPHRFNDTVLSTGDTQNRGDLYCQAIQAIPVIAVDGTVDPRDKDSSNHWPEVIKNGIEKHKEKAKFTFKLLTTGQFEVTATGTSDDLNQMNNLYMNVIFYQDWVSCNWENGDTTVRNLARKFPLGPYGQKIKLLNNKIATVKFDVAIPDEFRNMYGMVALIQDMNTYKIVSSGYHRFADTEKPAYFNWNSWPKFTYDPIKDEVLNEYMLKTGISEMKLNVKNAKELKFLQVELNYTDVERENYDFMGATMSDDLKSISKFSFDMENKKINIALNEPINGDKELFSLIIHWKKENLETSSSFKIKTLVADNSKKNSVYFDLNDIKQYFPNMLFVKANPLDFNSDSWIDDTDLSLLLLQFGKTETDADFDPKFDIVPTKQEARIDMNDVLLLLGEINYQEKLKQKIK